MTNTDLAVHGAPLAFKAIIYFSTFSTIFVASAWAAGMIRLSRGFLLVLAIQFMAAVTGATLAKIQGMEIGLNMKALTFWNNFVFLAPVNLVAYLAMILGLHVAKKHKR